MERMRKQDNLVCGREARKKKERREGEKAGQEREDKRGTLSQDIL